ncbi:hypothetical protein K3495_g405 [Podosphaera aphanis]|nr:hypothetical protein K3495_g405 [Podosphaera aphanis]
MSIEKLSQSSISQLESSSIIISLNQVVCELLKNSLDAGATHIDLSVDYERGSCIVEDNGEGILPSEFHETGGLCKAFHTSKRINSTIYHGSSGRFLANLSKEASSLTITSHHKWYRSHNTLIYDRQSWVTSRLIPAPVHHHLQFSHGTKVTVHNLFEHLPVRVKQRTIKSDWWMKWDKLVMIIVEHLLPQTTQILVVLRETSTGNKLFLGLSEEEIPSPNLCSILCQASLITIEDAESWVPVEALNSNFKIRGTISLRPSRTKDCQFLSVGIKPLQRNDNPLYDEINCLFHASNFGELDQLRAKNQHPENYGTSHASLKYIGEEIKVKRKSAEKWPKFCIKIEETNPSYSGHFWTQMSEKTLKSMVKLLQLLIWRFLKVNNFCPGNLQEQIPKTKKSLNSSSLIQKRKQDFHKLKMCSMSTRDELNFGYDPLGIDTKLPISCQSNVNTKPLPPFSSKIKTGTATTNCLKSFVAPKTSQSSKRIPILSPKPSNLNLEKTTMSEMISTSPRIRTTENLVRINGLSRPFDNIAICPRSGRKDEMKNTNLSSLDGSISEINELKGSPITTWMCPRSKKKLLVNRRSGLAVTSTKTSSIERTLNISLFTIPFQTKPDPSDSLWISRMLGTWDNPVYSPAEKAVQCFSSYTDLSKLNVHHGPRHNCSPSDGDRVFNIPFGLSSRISKKALQAAKLIAQVDKKFILLKLCASMNETNKRSEDILVMVDQHAADERVRIESLLKDFCSPVKPRQIASPIQIKTHLLNKPLIFKLAPKEAQLFVRYKAHYSRWGVVYEVSEKFAAADKPHASSNLTVLAVPPTIARRCQTQPELLASLLRAELPRLQERCLSTDSELPRPDSINWINCIHDCPVGILDLLNSRACRSAIMFNDELSRESCDYLIRQLANCVFPFQCAHGRPSMVPLVSLDPVITSIGGGQSHGKSPFQKSEMRRPNEDSFGAQFQKWKTRMGPS